LLHHFQRRELMPGKYDPPDKARLLAKFRRTPSIAEVMVAAAEAQFPTIPKTEGDASRARPAEDSTHLAESQPRKRGRKPVVTPEKVQMICELLARGETERGACIRAGVGSTAWNGAKRVDAGLRDRIASARDDWARLRHQQHAAALFASQTARSAGRKALKPSPTKQAKWMVWHLATCVPLNFAAIPEEEIASACERCGLSLETWRRQERTFALMGKVYAKRAKIRGEQQHVAAWAQLPDQEWEQSETDY
jgi:hypothetical protein